MYKAVGSRGSRVSRVLWMLEELGEAYEFVEVKLRSPQAYALNPSGKVPVLIDGEVVVTDFCRDLRLSRRQAFRKRHGLRSWTGRAGGDGWLDAFCPVGIRGAAVEQAEVSIPLPKEVRVDVGPAVAHDFAIEVQARTDGWANYSLRWGTHSAPSM